MYVYISMHDPTNEERDMSGSEEKETHASELGHFVHALAEPTTRPVERRVLVFRGHLVLFRQCQRIHLHE